MQQQDYNDINYSLSATQYLSELSYNRLFVIGLMFIISFFIVAGKLVLLVIASDIEDTHQYTQSDPFFMHRKEIVDRNGVLLAVNLSTASLYAKPKYIFEPEQVAKKLVSIFPDLNYKNLVADFTGKKKFIWIKRNISPKEQYAVNNLGIPGLDFEKGEKRVYLQENVLSHVLGYVDVDGRGIAGIEKYFDKFLLSSNYRNQEENNNLTLSIDVRVQNAVYEVLWKAYKEYRADGAVGIVMDANNGEIYSMVSLPDFDPHAPSKSSKEQLFNKASLGVFELGSVLKLCTMAMALDNKSISLNDVYYVKEPIKASRFKISDYKPKYSWLSVPEIFMYSSNIGTARISLELGAESQKKFLKKFGLTDKLSVELPEKGMPMMPQDNRWSDINTMTISYGHGIAITPLHFTQITGAMVNGGYLYPATLIKDTNNNKYKKIETIISPETSEKIRKLLRLVVTNGSGRRANIEGYVVGGKSGSADKSIKGGYSTNSKISSFVAAFPMHDPKFVVMLMIDAPKAESNELTMGGRAIAPLAKEIISKIGPILQIKPVGNDDPEVNEKLELEYRTDTEILESF